MKLEDSADGWELDDAEVRQRNAPDLYSIPPLEERLDVQVGERVALHFYFRGRDQHGVYIQSERLRLTVRAASPFGYVGILDETPASSILLHKGDSVSFEPRHIAGIYWNPGTSS